MNPEHWKAVPAEAYLNGPKPPQFTPPGCWWFVVTADPGYRAAKILGPVQKRAAEIVVALHNASIDRAGRGGGPSQSTNIRDLVLEAEGAGSKEGKDYDGCTCCRCMEIAKLGRPAFWWPRNVPPFLVCPDCGNKRCPQNQDHRNRCTGSNDPDQIPVPKQKKET